MTRMSKLVSQRPPVVPCFYPCYQITQPLGIRADSPMFLPHPWSKKWMTEHCQRRFGVTPQFEHIRDTMGLADITKWPQPARVIFSNGLQDPWHAGGVLTNATSSMIVRTLHRALSSYGNLGLIIDLCV